MLRITVTAAALSLLCGTPAALSSAAPDGPSTSGASVGLVASHRAALRGALDRSVDASDLESMALAAAAQPLVFEEVPGRQEFRGELIVRTKSGKPGVADARLAPSIVRSSAFVREHVLRVPAGMTEGEFAAALMSTGDYMYAEPNWTLFPLGTVPNDPQFGSSWQHSRIDSSDAWDITTGDPGVVVAVCDSGVDSNHPDLMDSLVPGYNAADGLTEAQGGSTEDINGHGTFVAGMAAARGNNSEGVVGAGWNFLVMPVRVSNSPSGSASPFALVEGARWAANNGARVVNVSFSGVTGGANQAAALDVINAGGLLFWAAGNDSSNISGNARDLIAVASTTSSDNRSGFSNFGSAVDIAAPGSSVRSTRIGGSYGNSSGTSFASPMAAGVAAMIFSANAELSPRDVQDILNKSADDLGAPGRDDFFGHGRVNTANGVTMALTYTPRAALPIDEGFESSSWMDMFESATGVVTTAPGDSGDALEIEGGESVVTVPLEAASIGTMMPYFAFSFDPGAAGAGDTLVAEYLDEQGVWNAFYSYAAHASGPDAPVLVETILPSGYFWHGTQVRLTGSGGTFLVDDVSLTNVFPERGGEFSDAFDSGVFSPLDWTTSEGVETEVVSGSYAASFNGDETLESREIPVVDIFSPDPLQIAFDLWGDPALDAGDSILIEMFTSTGEWETIVDLGGDSISTTREPFLIEPSLLVRVANPSRLRVVASTDAEIYLDNIRIGVNLNADAPCNGADTTAPFGELTFTDVSFYLGLFATGDPAADLTGDGSATFSDISLFLSLFSAGCP